MAVPKKRKSHACTRKGRSHHALVPVHVMECSQCKNPTRRHRMCECGFYKGRQVIQVAQSS